MTNQQVLEKIDAQMEELRSVGRNPENVILGFQNFCLMSPEVRQKVNSRGLRIIVNKVIPYKVSVL